MKTKTIMTMIVILAVSLNIWAKKSILENYETKSKVYSSKTINAYYTGPIFATGGAMSDINRYIKDMEPTKIGGIEKNSITLIESDTLENQIYKFNKATCYKVTSKGQSFSIIYMKCKMNAEEYEIVIELKEGPNYDRTLNIFKDNKPTVLILCVDNNRIVQKKGELDI